MNDNRLKEFIKEEVNLSLASEFMIECLANRFDVSEKVIDELVDSTVEHVTDVIYNNMNNNFKRHLHRIIIQEVEKYMQQEIKKQK